MGSWITAPLFVYAAIRIKLDSAGPVFFRQERLGLDMRPFRCAKFRHDAGRHGSRGAPCLVESITSSRASVNGNGMYKLNRDDAVTPFGRWLRKTSLDELPQLINVVRGDMSIVGPRPCIPYEIEFFQPHHVERFLVPQGITGLWQVSAGANSTFGEARHGRRLRARLVARAGSAAALPHAVRTPPQRRATA